MNHLRPWLARSFAHPPFTALSLWTDLYVDFIATKVGLCKALYSGDAAYRALPEYFNKRLRPALITLLESLRSPRVRIHRDVGFTVKGSVARRASIPFGTLELQDSGVQIFE